MQLIDVLSSTPEARVVTVSSLAHRQGKISFDDLHWQKRGHSASSAYGQSKLANLLFTQELKRRFDEAGVKVRAVAAHPGWTVTNLQQHSFLFRMLNPIFGMRPPQGASPPSSRQPHPTRRTAATTARTAFLSCVATPRKRRNPRRPRTQRRGPPVGSLGATHGCSIRSRRSLVERGELTAERWSSRDCRCFRSGILWSPSIHQLS